MPPFAKLVVFHPSPNLVDMVDGLLLKLAPSIPYENLIVPDLLDRAIRQGVSREIIEEVATIVASVPLEPRPLIFCTCSTLGGHAERAGQKLGRSVIRIDRPMAEQAIKLGQKIGVAAALASTIAPTSDLLQEVADERQKPIEIGTILCDEAWAHKVRGDNAAYIAEVARCLERVAKEFDVIVLAQGSMAPAKELLVHLQVPVLTSPDLGVERVVQMMSAQE